MECQRCQYYYHCKATKNEIYERNKDKEFTSCANFQDMADYEYNNKE